MASRFDDSSSGSSEDEEEAPQLDGMTSSEDEGASGDAYDDDLDAGELEVRGRGNEKNDGLHWPATISTKNFIVSPNSSSLTLSRF